MIYWLLAILLIPIIIISADIIKRRYTKNKKLDEIRNHWGIPKNTYRNFRLIEIYLTATGAKYAATASDLDLNDVFCYIDRTNSRLGQQYLFKRLQSPEISESYLNTLEQHIEKFNDDPQLREQTELKLSVLNNDYAYYLPELFTQKQQTVFGPLVQYYIRIAGPLIVALVVGLVLAPNSAFALLLFAVVIANFFIHYTNKSKMVKYTHSLPQVMLLGNVSEWLSANGLIAETDNIKQSRVNVAKLKKSLSFINVQNKVAADPTDVVYLVTEWVKILFMLEPLNFIISISKVNQYPDDIRLLYECVAEVDVAISVLSVRQSLPHYCKPEFVDNCDSIEIKDLYHPLIENCVLNSITLDNRHGALITGSNMSGKTTFIRAIAINALLSETINTSLATTYKAPPLKIFTSINMSDDLSGHTSYYQAEALSIRTIIDNCIASKPISSLVIIDEIFRGTNTIERIAAAKAVLSYFVKNKNFVLVSTHDLELAELLGNDYKVFSFEEKMGEGRLAFDYKIKNGLLKNKNGIAVLEGLDYPGDIIKEASEISTLLRDKYNL